MAGACGVVLACAWGAAAKKVLGLVAVMVMKKLVRVKVVVVGLVAVVAAAVTVAV
jgi:hypothetical protein